jgi:hypothetical protein
LAYDLEGLAAGVRQTEKRKQLDQRLQAFSGKQKSIAFYPQLFFEKDLEPLARWS